MRVLVAAFLSALILVSATGWGFLVSRRATKPWLYFGWAVVVILSALQWLILDPIHRPVLLALSHGVGLTLGDLLVLPAGGTLLLLVRSARRRTKESTVP